MDGGGSGAVMSALAASRPGGREVRIDHAVYAVEEAIPRARHAPGEWCGFPVSGRVAVALSA